MTRSSDLEELAARHAALEAELAEQERELARSRELLADARQRRRLPTIADIRVASPCRADWSRMVGDDRVRHCGDCKKYVYNLSAMTRAEAEALIASLEREPCVRYYERPDGTILFADCSVIRSRRRRTRGAVAGAVLAAGAGLAQLLSLPPEEPEVGVEAQVVLGGMSPEFEPEADALVEIGAVAWEPEAPKETVRARAVEEAEAAARRKVVPGPRLPPRDESYLRIYRETVPDAEE